MNHNTLAMLDQAELQQLALNASAANESASAIAYWKEAVSRADASAQAHYLLGAEYAQIQMYERAIDEMEAAVALDPSLSVARLQLAMLLLGANQAARADEVLTVLEQLDNGNPLHHFGAGLRHLIAERMAEALHSLGQGVALNHVNPPLNHDMQRIMQQIELGQAGGTAATAPDAPAPAEEEGQHLLLSAYTGMRH